MVTKPVSAADAGVRPADSEYDLPVSRYDRVASLLLALLLLVGLGVAALLLLWLTNSEFSSRKAHEVTRIQPGDGEAAGSIPEIETQSDEFADQAAFEQPDTATTLTTIADAVSAKAAQIEQPGLGDRVEGDGQGPPGDPRTRGLDRGSRKPRRWEVTLTGDNTVDAYARQLDFFKIELGVLLPGNRVEYAQNLAKQKPDRRARAADQEQRYYLAWHKGELRKADQELLRKAGIDAGSRPILKFLPETLEEELVQLELQRAGENAKRIYTTYFAIRTKGDGYEFYVQDQTYKY